MISNLKLHIDVSITKRNYLWQITLLTVLIGGIGGWAYYSVFPHHYFGGYPLIPIFFLTFGVFMINMVESCRHRRMLQIYLLMRVMRMLASIIVMLVYCVAVREEAKEFLLTFIVNYLIYLIYDSWFFFTFEANRKLKKKKRKENETIA